MARKRGQLVIQGLNCQSDSAFLHSHATVNPSDGIERLKMTDAFRFCAEALKDVGCHYHVFLPFLFRRLLPSPRIYGGKFLTDA